MFIKKLSTEEVINSLMCDEYANWSPEAAQAIAFYFEELSDDLGEDIEFDRVAIRCDFTEYGCLQDIIDCYPHIETIDDLRDETTVIEFNGGLVIGDF